MKRHFFLYTTLLTSLLTQAQPIAEIKGITFYEHHSSDMTGAAFGNSANGSKSGYDFVKRKYYNSFNALTFGAYTNGEEQNIDMVENDGPFGTAGASMYLGFTSGVSSIWGGEIKGNGTTLWHKVSGGVTAYDNLKNYTDLKSYYTASMAVQSISEVKADEVYIGKIRNTDLYVMIRCTSVKIPTSPSGTQNAAFMFDYKFGSEGGVTGIQETQSINLVSYPNPVQHTLFIQTPNTVTPDQLLLIDMNGKQITIPAQYLSIQRYEIAINTTFLTSGLYKLIVLNEGETLSYSSSFIKAD